ncbi:hypothetical protein BDV26DRAFT_251259, partial [Aspergillus bertholletiae]
MISLEIYPTLLMYFLISQFPSVFIIIVPVNPPPPLCVELWIMGLVPVTFNYGLSCTFSYVL